MSYIEIEIVEQAVLAVEADSKGFTPSSIHRSVSFELVPVLSVDASSRISGSNQAARRVSPRISIWYKSTSPLGDTNPTPFFPVADHSLMLTNISPTLSGGAQSGPLHYKGRRL
jgi:hypothetical protein